MSPAPPTHIESWDEAVLYGFHGTNDAAPEAPGPEVGEPALTEVVPAEGPEAGDTTVELAGVNLTGATTVKFGAKAAASFTVDDDALITAVSPAAAVAGIVDMEVVTPAGSAVLPGAYTYT
jgi:hypothetical protein